MKYKAIIFDLDGVICSTDEYHYRAWKALADRLGIYFDRTINDRLRGVSRMASLDIVLEKSAVSYTEEEKAVFASEKNRLYRALLSEMSERDLSAEVKNTLNELRKRGYLLAVGSSSKNARYILDRLGLGGFFDAVADGTDISRSKPDPEVFLKAAERLEVEPEHCLVVEDSLAGIEAARAGGMKAAAIGSAAGKGCGDHILGEFSDLLTDGVAGATD